MLPFAAPYTTQPVHVCACPTRVLDGSSQYRVRTVISMMHGQVFIVMKLFLQGTLDEGNKPLSFETTAVLRRMYGRPP